MVARATKIEFRSATALVDHLNGRLGMVGMYLSKESHRGEICYFSPTNVLLFTVNIYRNAFYGWMVDRSSLRLVLEKIID